MLGLLHQLLSISNLFIFKKGRQNSCKLWTPLEGIRGITCLYVSFSLGDGIIGITGVFVWLDDGYRSFVKHGTLAIVQDFVFH